MRSNYTPSNQLRQVFSHNSNEIKENILNLIVHYQQYSSLRLMLMGKIIAYNTSMETLEMSQDYLAKTIGGCVSTVQRGLDDLVAAGLLKKKFRYHGKGREQTNLYTLHPVASTREFLEVCAGHFHEIKLYLLRTAREYNLKLMAKISKKVQTVKCALSAIFNGGAVPFNSLSKSSYLNYIWQSTARARKGDGTARDSDRKEKGEGHTKRGSMEEYVLRPAVKKISTHNRLQLTLSGSIFVAGAPDKVIAIAFERLNKNPKIDKPFKWLSVTLQGICKDLGLHYDWALIRQLQAHFGVKDNDPKIVAAVGNGARTVKNLDFIAKPPIARPPQSLSISSPLPNTEKTQTVKKDFEGMTGSKSTLDFFKELACRLSQSAEQNIES